MELKSSKTYENLKKAFISECAARTRYEFVEYGARYNGYESLAQIIDKIAYQEFNHARMLYTKIQSATKGTIDNEESKVSLPYRQKWELLDNLRLTAEDEEKEAEFYKKAAKTAREEGFEDVAALYKMIAEVEGQHKIIFQYLHDGVRNGTLYKSESPILWICSECGYMHVASEAWKVCPLCKSGQGYVELHLPFEGVRE